MNKTWMRVSDLVIKSMKMHNFQGTVANSIVFNSSSIVFNILEIVFLPHAANKPNIIVLSGDCCQ